MLSPNIATFSSSAVIVHEATYFRSEGKNNSTWNVPWNVYCSDTIRHDCVAQFIGQGWRRCRRKVALRSDGFSHILRPYKSPGKQKIADGGRYVGQWLLFKENETKLERTGCMLIFFENHKVGIGLVLCHWNQWVSWMHEQYMIALVMMQCIRDCYKNVY